jgi:translation initiation factor IF-2
MMYYDYNKRSYLLPPGCKDLIDLLRLEEHKKQLPFKLPTLPPTSGFVPSPQEFIGLWKLKKDKPKEPETSSAGTAASTSEVTIPGHGVLVIELAKLAGQKPFKIIADLMQIGIFANVKQKVGFDAAARVLKKYGITAKRAV